MVDSAFPFPESVEKWKSSGMEQSLIGRIESDENLAGSDNRLFSLSRNVILLYEVKCHFHPY